ncbi:MAG TPA: helix-turn-helix domain-containing protein [Mobilitalea sp.]|nr:helix-turn-helix domain-containing protein [Mobilitalea sp.]
MFNLLIVDDEKIIREGIHELLSMEENLELNLFMAASAVEAQAILESRKIDIVLTDIQMPQMTGIELMDIILERWPHCKVIFLTGYSQFEYVYRVYKHAKYILKAEEDSKIIDAVKETIEEIENDFLIQQIVLDSDILIQQKKKIERLTLLKDIVEGFIPVSSLTQNLVKKLDIPFDIEKELYYVVMHHEFKNFDSYEMQMQLNENIHQLLEKYYFDLMRGISIQYNKNFRLIILQPKKLITVERSIATLKGISELFQKAYMKNMNMSVSLYIGSKPMIFEDIVSRFHLLKAKLMMHSEEVLLLDSGIMNEGMNKSDSNENHVVQGNLLYSKIQMIDYYFENSDDEMVIAVIQEAMDNYKNTVSMHDLSAVSIYSTIASKLITYINQIGLSTEMCFKIGVINLYNLTLHNNWQEAFRYLISITNTIFELKMANVEKQGKDVINRVKIYIKENLNRDTSLDVLSDYVDLSPEYLLRLFKKREGQTILHYINELKIVKAKKLIVDGNLAIKDIATELGFTSAGYFSRFFKSKTGMTPQTFRENTESNRINSH